MSANYVINVSGFIKTVISNPNELCQPVVTFWIVTLITIHLILLVFMVLIFSNTVLIYRLNLSQLLSRSTEKRLNVVFKVCMKGWNIERKKLLFMKWDNISEICCYCKMEILWSHLGKLDIILKMKYLSVIELCDLTWFITANLSKHWFILKAL